MTDILVTGVSLAALIVVAGILGASLLLMALPTWAAMRMNPDAIKRDSRVSIRLSEHDTDEDY
jgi:hypothetical protein